MSTICILGRQPELGTAELESLFGADKIRVIRPEVVELEMDVAEVPYNRLGGTVKLAKLLTYVDTTIWNKIEHHFVKSTPDQARYMPEGKLTIGLSLYGYPLKQEQLTRTALKIKKAIRADSGRSVRIVPNNEGPELTSAQVLHNQLTGNQGWELLIIRDGDRTIIAQTTEVQDIYAYTARDRERPNRDAKVGMLPPKLAQIIVNLATGQNDVTQVLDPFCGSGVILQESVLMGYDVYGTDLEERMAKYTADNLTWLGSQYPMTKQQKTVIEVGNAAEYSWLPGFDTVASETYLGRPFSAEPDRVVLEAVMQDVNTIHRKFLKNLSKQIPHDFRFCIAVPAWYAGTSVKRLHILDQIEEIGYNVVSFESVQGPLIYRREGQVVGRELLVLTKR